MWMIKIRCDKFFKHSKVMVILASYLVCVLKHGVNDAIYRFNTLMLFISLSFIRNENAIQKSNYKSDVWLGV